MIKVHAPAQFIKPLCKVDNRIKRIFILKSLEVHTYTLNITLSVLYRGWGTTSANTHILTHSTHQINVF